MRWPNLRVLPLIFLVASASYAAHVTAVDSVALSVSDLDRSIDFYTNVLPFEKASETEIAGPEYEKRFGVFWFARACSTTAAG